VEGALPGGLPELTVSSVGTEAAIIDGIVEQLRAGGLPARAARNGESAHLVVRSFAVAIHDDPTLLLERLPADDRIQALIGEARQARTDTEGDEAWRALHAYLAEARPLLFLWKADLKSVWRAEVKHAIIGPSTYWGEFGVWRLSDGSPR
jgi:hypothetical protein